VIKFTQVNSKSWKMENNGKEFQLDLVTSSITNKFFIITDYIERLSNHHGEDFDKWFIDLFENYKNNKENRYQLLDNNTDKIKSFVNTYLDDMNFDYDRFVDESKATKSTIMFYAEDIRMIINLSCYLKIYVLFSNTEDMSLPSFLHMRIYNKLAKEILGSDVIFKIFNIIKTKTFRYNLTDKAMWNYIKVVECKTIESHVIEIFNFITNSILVLCKEDNNPIAYFVGVVDESVKWFLRSVYKGSMIYEDSVATEDIHTLSTDNLNTYVYNDTLGRLKGIAYSKIYNMLEEETSLKFSSRDGEDEEIVQFQNRVLDIEHISPLCECLVFPILSKITNIPYNHFKTLSAEHSAVLSVYTNILLNLVFKNNYKNLFFLLDYYPSVIPSLTTTYTIKNVHRYLHVHQKFKNFHGFVEKIIPYNIISHYIGRITRVGFYHIIDGTKLIGIPLSKTENDAIDFFNKFFAGQFEEEFSKMKRIMEMDF